MTAPTQSATETRNVAQSRYRKKTRFALEPRPPTLASPAFSYLQATYTRDDENEREGNKSEGDQQADLQDIFAHGSLVLPVERRPWLQTESIPHPAAC